MKALINALLMLVFFLLGLRMSGVVSKFAPFLVGSSQSSEVVIPNAPENHDNAPQESHDAVNVDPNAQQPAVTPEAVDPAAQQNIQPQDAQAIPAPAVAPVAPNAPVPAQNIQPQDAQAIPAPAVSPATAPVAQPVVAPATTPAVSPVATPASPVAAPVAPPKTEVKKAVATKSSAKKK